MNGLDGEADAATNLLDNDGREISQLNNQIDAPEGATDIDVDLEDGTAVEVKNRDYDDVPAYAANAREQELTTKLRKYAEERDDVVLAARGDPADSDLLQSVQETIEAEYPDTTVRLIRIEDLDSL